MSTGRIRRLKGLGGYGARSRRGRRDPILAEAGIEPLPSAAERPVIGVTTTAAGHVGTRQAGGPSDTAPTRLAEAIHDLGGVPVMLPPVASVAAVRRHVDLVDGLVLSGGPDIHPNLTGGRAAPGRRYDPRKDRYEWLLLDRALEARRPFLGAGRGLQLMNLFFGGTLGDLDAVRPVERLRVAVAPETRVGCAIGRAKVDMLHAGHRRVETLADGLAPGAHAADGTVWAVEVIDLPFAVAVGFDAEHLLEDGEVGRLLLAALIEAAAEASALAASGGTADAT